MSVFDFSVFKKYDIRGVYPQTINSEFAQRLGRSFGKYLTDIHHTTDLKIVVGQDMRLSSPELSFALINGLRQQGVNIIDIGQASTPTFYFSVANYHYDGGIQITASHNPKEYNGFKLVGRRAFPISADTGLQQIQNIFKRGKFQPPTKMGGLNTKINILKDLADVQRQQWKINLGNIKRLKVVFDAANSMGALDAQVMFQSLPCRLIKLNFNLDGNFPSHPADPLVPDNLKQLQQAVIDNKADLGIATDGDGDRYFFVDDQGEIIDSSLFRGLMAQIVLAQFPQQIVCYDIRPGRITQDLIDAVGGQAIVTPVGHSLIKQIMVENDAIFGGESSGHYFFRFQEGSFEAPFVLVWKFLEYISQHNQPLSQILAPMRGHYFHSGEINSEVKSVNQVLDRIKSKFADAKISTLDGVTIEYPDYWFNVRGSNTEPLIRLNLEAKSQQLMEQKRDQVLALIRK